jgi:hypothetical protein
MRTPRDKFLAHLKKTMVHGETATERTEAMKLYSAATSGMADGATPIVDGSIPLPDLQTPIVSKPLTEFEAMAAIKDCTGLMHTVRALLAEAQDFVCWRQALGEPSSQMWGDWQKQYSHDLHIKHREQAVQLNELIAKYGFDVQRFWNNWFEQPAERYPVEVRQQARLELGI